MCPCPCLFMSLCVDGSPYSYFSRSAASHECLLQSTAVFVRLHQLCLLTRVAACPHLVQMNRVVDKIFSWMERHRTETEAMREEALRWQVMQTIETAKR